jgi:peroxiredoxin Q/BCP
MDTPESHRAFRDKHNLPFVLLSDPTGAMIRAYGAWGKKMFGHEGIQRKTFIIDPEGVVQKVYGRVNPIGHGDQLLQDIRQLQN